jgi:hypothetical protein
MLSTKNLALLERLSALEEILRVRYCLLRYGILLFSITSMLNLESLLSGCYFKMFFNFISIMSYEFCFTFLGRFLRDGRTYFDDSSIQFTTFSMSVSKIKCCFLNIKFEGLECYITAIQFIYS